MSTSLHASYHSAGYTSRYGEDEPAEPEIAERQMRDECRLEYFVIIELFKETPCQGADNFSSYCLVVYPV